MSNLFSKLGGRKVTLLLVATVLTALQDTLGLSDESINKIIQLALGGSGIVAVEDIFKHLFGKKKKK